MLHPTGQRRQLKMARGFIAAKYENYQELWTATKWKSQQSTRITTPHPIPTLSRALHTHTKTTRIAMKNEHRRSTRVGKYETLETKPAYAGRGHPETTKIERRNEHASTQPRK